jgi:histidine triad (HIT) family protein
MENCLFCRIAQNILPAELVWQDERCLAFLDTKPLFPGHILLIPREHFETLKDLPKEVRDHLFELAQRLAVAVETAMGAEGSFVAMNNVVSQSISHFHVHIVPRRKGDGLRGFFWPRSKYASGQEANGVAELIRQALKNSEIS